MTRRLSITIRGAVQGVGFRPFIYRLASTLHLTGWVSNSPLGVFIEVEGDQQSLEAFLLAVVNDHPPRAIIQSLEHLILDPAGYEKFEIRPSESSGEVSALVLPDIALCGDCLRELFDPTDRRYLYPFINCTNCGPRYSIIEALPYDRPNTSMRAFPMCERCREEYENPLDRRFHAQPVACPACGPRAELWDARGVALSEGQEAIVRTASALRSGGIVAVKGIGGFHLMADAGNADAVTLLRARKHREEKPLALMAPSLDVARGYCDVSALEERLLVSPESPIVLLHRNAGNNSITDAVAPRNPFLGVMLPYSPLHHLLMREIGTTVVATSGNLSEEPICTDEHEALVRLKGIADLFLVHNRPIVRHVDDSVVRVTLGRELVLRRARGFAPLPVDSARQTHREIVAVGAHLKNTIALNKGANVFVSQHIGDLGSAQSYDAFLKVNEAFNRLFDAHPDAIASDLHPSYRSTDFALGTGLPLEKVQHHYAHLASCMADNRLEGRVLGVTWDGTGFGPDGTIWGGEFLLTDATSFRRVASLRRFRLPGGEEAVREPRRAAFGLLAELLGEAIADVADLPSLKAVPARAQTLFRRMLQRRINCPLTSSAGRLFDAVASLIGLRQVNAFEGQAAMELEFAAEGTPDIEPYPFTLSPHPCRTEEQPRDGGASQGIVVDWSEMVHGIIGDVRRGVLPGEISFRFHRTLAGMIVAVARRIGEQRVVLTGGCFQNNLLTELAVTELERAGFRVYWHQRIPPNDGGIALGQIAAVQRSEPVVQLPPGNPAFVEEETQ